MKSIYKYFSCIFVLLLPIIPICAYANRDINKAPEIDSVKFQQIKAQVYLFKQVLDEFGATSPSQAVELWAKSESKRNGVYQYAVSCEELKQKIIEKWGKAEENFWIIGGSSPSTYKYEIVENEKINENTYRVKLKFYWASSLGEEEPTYNILTIVKGEKYWCVKDYK
jgi:hypothetical protein